MSDLSRCGRLFATTHPFTLCSHELPLSLTPLLVCHPFLLHDLSGLCALAPIQIMFLVKKSWPSVKGAFSDERPNSQWYSSQRMRVSETPRPGER
jgi:hypothetical protein